MLLLEPRVRMSLLHELYRALLTPWQGQVLELYYDQDWSLAEIASVRSVSRAAVHSVLKRTESILDDYEQKLGLLGAHVERDRLVKQLQELLSDETLTQREVIMDLLEQLHK